MVLIIVEAILAVIIVDMVEVIKLGMVIVHY